jgi:hypothetical protein
MASLVSCDWAKKMAIVQMGRFGPDREKLRRRDARLPRMPQAEWLAQDGGLPTERAAFA